MQSINSKYKVRIEISDISNEQQKALDFLGTHLK